MRGNGTRSRRLSNRSSEAGMSLIEVMVAVTLLGVVAIAFYQTYHESQRHLVKGQAVMDMQQNTRIALETVAAELRSARSIVQMDGDQVTFTSDLFVPGQRRILHMDLEDMDLDLCTDELVLTRTPADDGSPTVQSDEVATSIEGVAFRYLNALDGSSEAQSPDQIRRIEVTVTGRLPERYADSTEVSFQAVVKPRNLRLPQPPSPDDEAPGAPANVSLLPICAVINITWDANPEEDIAGYRVFYDTDSSGEPYEGSGADQGSSPIYVGNRTSFDLSGLDPSLTYYVVLTAVDQSGNEGPGSIERVAVPSDGFAPGAPTGLAVEVGGETSLVVAWDANPEADVEYYRVYYDSDASGPPYAAADSTQDTSLRLEDLSTDVLYYIAVTANDACGNESGYSGEVTGIPRPCSEDATPPATPQGFEGMPGDGKAILDWDANGEPDLYTYRLLYSWDASSDSLDVGLGTRYELEGLANDTDYTFRLVALDGCGNRSGESAAVVVRPLSCAGDEMAPAAPSLVCVEDARAEGGDELLVSWAPNSEGDVAGYRIYCGSASLSYGTPIDVGNEVFYTLAGLVPEQRYYLSVVAYDRCGNVSGYSTEESGVPTCGCSCVPAVSFVSPADQAVVEHVVSLVAEATACSSQTIVRVELQVKTFPERTWLESPYTHLWDTRRWPDGPCTLVLVATDVDNCVGQDTIEVFIDNTGTGPGCIRVAASVPATTAGTFDEEVNFGILNTSAVQSCEVTALTTHWTTQNPEMTVARLHRIEIPIGAEVWDSGPLVDDAVASGADVVLTYPPTLAGGTNETVGLHFWHEDGDLNPGGRTNVPMVEVLIRTQADVWPTRLCPADSFYTSCTIAVTDLTVTTGRAYEVDYLGVGDTYYIDRTYVIQGIPSEFRGLLWIKTANNDKYGDDSYRLEFDVDRPVTVYVAYDPRDTAAGWVREDFTPVGQSIDVSDVDADVLNLWARDYPAGHITLYGNRASGAGAGILTNYVVLLDCR